jgi:Macrocin-O-methyltransferase (TylF)
MMDIQQYINQDKKQRDVAKEKILQSIEDNRLKPPQFVIEKEKYGVILEGLSIGRYQPWIGDKQYKTALSPDRLYMIKQLSEIAPDGVCFELGVFTGGVTRMLLDSGRNVVAFDTFEGIKGSGEFDLHKDGEYNGGDVFEYINGAEIVKGFVPETLVGRSDKVAFVHMDMDIYGPTRDALAMIYPMLVDGGIIVMDDYGFWTTPGIKKAVDEFNLGKKMYLPTGQMVIFKR